MVGVGSHADDGALHSPDELPMLLPRANAVVILAPLTEATRGLIWDGRPWRGCRTGRSWSTRPVDPSWTPARSSPSSNGGRLRAVLDVVDPEPLGDDHPLWRAPELPALTPHIAGDSPAGGGAAAALAGDQLARWCRGEELLNIVRRGA